MPDMTKWPKDAADAYMKERERAHELWKRAEKAERLLSDTQESLREHMTGWKRAEAERDEARADVARLQDLHARCAAFDDQPGPSCVRLAADAARLRERLQIDPGGSDKIDELSAALDYLHADAARLREALVGLRVYASNCFCLDGDAPEVGHADYCVTARAALAKVKPR